MNTIGSPTRFDRDLATLADNYNRCVDGYRDPKPIYAALAAGLSAHGAKSRALAYRSGRYLMWVETSVRAGTLHHEIRREIPMGS